MFWKFTPPSTSIATLLENEDVTLKKLLDDEEILQECKGQNSKLIEFLSKKEIIEDLVDMIISEPEENSDEASKYKYSNLACEILTSDINQINNVLGDTESIREKLFSFLNLEPPFNPLLASFFSKVIGILLTRKPEPTLEYIKNADDFLSLVLKHIGTSAIMDLLLRMVTCVEVAELRADILKWLNENKLIEKLIERIDPIYDEEIHCNCSQALCDIIRLSREHMYTLQESAQEDPLLSTLEREETVTLLMKHMFDGEVNESVIVNGINVLLALLEIKRPAPYGFPDMVPELTQLDVERLARGVSKILHGLSGRLGDFHKLLKDPPRRESMQCTFGELDPPFGNTRLQVCKLLYAILVTNTHNINCQLAELKIFNVLLDLFFKYEFNNFLHTQVMHCIQTVLTNAATVTAVPVANKTDETATENHKEDEDKEEENTQTPEIKNQDQTRSENTRIVAPLLAHLFEECQIISRLTKSWDTNGSDDQDISTHRKGNLGHLVAIANAIVDNAEKGSNNERIKQFTSEMPEEDQESWHKFINETLSDINEKNLRELGGHNPTSFSSDEDEPIDPDFQNVPFNTGSSMQQAYTEYELQQMTSNFIDQFGFPDDDFADHDDNEKFNKINNLDFDISCSTNSSSEQLFAEVCRDRQASLGIDEDGDKKDEWPEREINFPISTHAGRQRTESGDSNSSNDSDDHQYIPPLLISESEDMDTSNSHGWRATFDDAAGESSESSNNSTPDNSPRETNVDSSQTNNENWANFDDLTSVGVNVSVKPSENATNQQVTVSEGRSSAYVVLETNVTNSDANVGSPMSISYDNTADKNENSSDSVMDSEESSVSKEDATSSSDTIDVVMHDEFPASTGTQESSQEKTPEQTLDTKSLSPQAVVESSSVATESGDVAMDSNAETSMETSVNVSDIKRQRIDESNSSELSTSAESSESAGDVSSTSSEVSSAVTLAQTEEVVNNEISSSDEVVNEKNEETPVNCVTSQSDAAEPVVASIVAEEPSAAANKVVQDNEVSSSEIKTKEDVQTNQDPVQIKVNGPV